MINFECARSLQSDQLNGLRFFAFFAVLLYHFRFNVPAEYATLLRFENLGWIGVEIFFALSCFLLFRLFEQEHQRTGTISISMFFARRLLRIYPLMLAFSVLMFWVHGPQNSSAVGWFTGIVTGVSNFLLWRPDVSKSIPDTSHLWSLAFELQIYLVLPFLFLAFKSCGRRAFILGLLAAVPICFAARAAFGFSGLSGMPIHGTPFLRPEPSLAGIAIAIGALDAVPLVIVWAAFLLSGAILTFSPELGLNVGGIGIYLPSGIFSGALLYIVLHSRWIATVLRWRPLAWLGEISFGLYVFHTWALELGRAAVLGPFRNHLISLPLRLCIVLLISIALAAASYYFFERFFLRMKPRSSVAANSHHPADLDRRLAIPAE